MSDLVGNPKDPFSLDEAQMHDDHMITEHVYDESVTQEKCKNIRVVQEK